MTTCRVRRFLLVTRALVAIRRFGGWKKSRDILTLFFRVASNEAEAKRGGVAAFALNLVNGELGLFNCDVVA